MKLVEFKQQKSTGRTEILSNALAIFKSEKAVAIHQFGSGTQGFKDEFSDIDLWVTFPDDVIENVVNNRVKIFSQIAPVLIIGETKPHSPLGGIYDLVIHETEHGLFHVDYYLSKQSENIIRSDAKLLFGDDSLPKGEWKLQTEASNERGKEGTLNQLLVMAFILNKAIVRGGWAESHAGYIKQLYEEVGKLYETNLPALQNSADFEFLLQLFNNLLPLADEHQNHAIEKLKEYTRQVQSLYS